MSDIEQSETIQAPIAVIRRKYQRKPRSAEVSDLENSEPVELVENIKPKRQYNRKPKPVYEESNSTVEPIPEPIPESQEAMSLTSLPIPESTPEPVKESSLERSQSQGDKKPRTEKQIAAFNRMREARLKKSQELQDLKAFQKEKDLLEKEQAKIQKIEEKIVRKRQPKTPKNKQVDNHTEDHIPQVSTHRPILFV